jgi:hypothetical protein
MVLIQYYGLRNILVNKEFFFQELQMDNWLILFFVEWKP